MSIVLICIKKFNTLFSQCLQGFEGSFNSCIMYYYILNLYSIYTLCTHYTLCT